MIKRRLISLNTKMIVMLVFALLVAVLVFFGGNYVSEWAINRWYMNDEAVAERNVAHLRSLQQYVKEYGVASNDAAALEVWARTEENASVIVYRNGDEPYETGWWGTDQILEGVEPADISELGYGFFPLAFADGVFQVAMCDVSETDLNFIAQMTVLGVSFVVFITIMLLFTHRITHKISRLSAEVNAVSSGELEEPISSKGGDELAQLAQDVNRMRDSIIDRTRNEQTAWQANSDLITALSHDIRNPLTSLIGYLELLEMDQERLPEELRQYVFSSLDKAYRLKDLTGEMFRYFLVFGRQEQDLQMETYDAQILLEQLLGEYVAELRNRGFHVNTVTLQTPCRVHTDVHMLKRVMDNLMSNLEKYADPNKPLAILASVEDGALHVCIANRTKTMSNQVESNRIGLRTCEAIMKLLGGEFSTYRETDGFTAEMILPLET